MSLERSLMNSHFVEPAENSSGDEGELRRIGLSSRKTNGLISGPIKLAGNGARFAWMAPIAISMLEVQWARV
jgi:hypothetical protein